ncbi:hypothetical protein [uncultured Aquabacterium sp.]|uniref:hypothetical protein n=1 Tax=uncultured Aquabacterium sp. TaxID=158753 RepID=UPI0025FCE337|nr:hypothetical protein [uncultured Aquabacterium sp.]
MTTTTAAQVAPKDKTAAERKRREREDKRCAGLKRLELWLPPEQHDAVRKFAQSLDTKSSYDAE